MHFDCWKQEFKATDAAKNICQVQGKGTVEVLTAKYWFKKFNEGCDTSPLILHSGAILNTVETNQSTSIRSKLSHKLGISHTLVIRTLKAHGKVNKCCLEVSHIH